MSRNTLLFGCFLTACSGAQPKKSVVPEPQVVVTPEAFTKGKIHMSTVEDSAPKMRDIVIAILPLRNNTPDKSLDATGEALSDLLSAQFSKNPRIQVVERSRINELIDELARGDVGPVDPATAARYGKMLGANIMTFGSFGKIGKSYTVTLRIVKVETSQIVGGANEYLEDLDDLGPHAQALSAKLIAEMTRAR